MTAPATPIEYETRIRVQPYDLVNQTSYLTPLEDFQLESSNGILVSLLVSDYLVKACFNQVWLYFI